MKTKSNGFLYNSLLYYGIGLVPAILVCTSLKSAVYFGILMLFTLLLSNLLVAFFKEIIPRSVRIPIFMLIVFSAVYFVDAIVYLIQPLSYASYTPIIAMIIVSTVLLFRAEEGGFKNNNIGFALWDGFSHGSAYLIAVAIIGLAREYLSYGTIWEIETAWSGASFNFDSTLGAILITAVVSFIYNVITIPLRKKQKIFDSLVERYTAYLKKTMYSDDNVIDENFRK